MRELIAGPEVLWLIGRLIEASGAAVPVLAVLALLAVLGKVAVLGKLAVRAPVTLVRGC